jgi:hypothetical protein
MSRVVRLPPLIEEHGGCKDFFLRQIGSPKYKISFSCSLSSLLNSNKKRSFYDQSVDWFQVYIFCFF